VASVDDLTAAQDLGVSLADRLLKAGAAEILAATKKQMIDDIVRQKAEKAAKLAIIVQHIYFNMCFKTISFAFFLLTLFNSSFHCYLVSFRNDIV
jgi:hypothetical protein